MISNPILHDIIKSEIDHNYVDIKRICENEILPVKTSRLFKGDYWTLINSRQEQLNKKWYQADAVWFFEGKNGDAYYIIHEIKTGGYDINEVYKKYYNGMNSQIWIWAWRQKHLENGLGNINKRKIKLLNIEYLIPIVKQDLLFILRGIDK